MEKNKENGNNGIGEETNENLKSKPIYLKVSDATRMIIDKYKDLGLTISNLIRDAIKMYDDHNSMAPEAQGIIKKYKNQEESIVNFLERVLKYYDDLMNVDRDLWIRARDEMKMMLIGKTTFNQLIRAAAEPSTALDKPFKKNVSFELIMWYNNARPLKSLTIEEIIHTIQKIWVVANYFYSIDINKDAKDEYHMLFRHRQNKRYSEYWLGYFTELFHSKDMPFQCVLEGQTYDESLSITIKVAYEK
ncbi:MAG: hypothetical protein ACTSPN_11000 [Promethearchaeota archaeon]